MDDIYENKALMSEGTEKAAPSDETKKTEDESQAKNAELCRKILKRKAKGYSFSETVDEYSVDEAGGLKHTKRKITQKYMPPDLTAIKMLLNESGEKNELYLLTDEEIDAEKKRLLKLLEGECTNSC